MYKSALLVAMVMMVVACAGCQQSGLSEEEIRSIVQEEVTSIVQEQFTSIVQEEVTRQLASADSLVLSKLFITDKDGNCVAFLSSEPNDSGELWLYNAKGAPVAWLGSSAEGHGVLGLINSQGQYIVLLGADADGDGFLHITDKYNVPVFRTETE